ncbi:MAG: HEAT repeat domain-containing protein [Bacteroidetes bacterium]|nr:HEAT repeat domain-containing protein [Bacteroidota bacterium]
MLTKENIKELKAKGNDDIAFLIRENLKSNKYILNILENLGRLPNDFDGSWLPELLENKSQQVRYWVVKNLGKISSDQNLDTLINVLNCEEDTTVRREAVSSIGRMRNPKAQNILIQILNDKDPKVIIQAIRGLLIFKGNERIDNCLKELINHENEMIRTVIYKEYFANTKDKTNQQPHSKSYDFLKNVIVNGDVREILRSIPEESFHLTFTSPPYYNARDYSIYPSYQAYLDFLNEVFLEVFKKTKEGRFLIVNTSPIIIPRISRSHSSKRYPIPFDLHPYLVNMGWEFIDDIIWLKPEASVKNRNAGFLQHRKPIGYKPNAITEYLMVYRKQTDKLIDWNIKQYNWKTIKESKVEDGYETSNVWRIDPKFDKTHSAVFPVELCKRVVEYYSFKGDLVFDPFGGSGTLGRTAKSLNRYFFLTEIEKKYFEYMKSFLTKDTIFNELSSKFLTYPEFKKTIIT